MAYRHVALIVLVTVFLGCGSGKKSGPKGKTTAEQKKESPKKSEGKPAKIKEENKEDIAFFKKLGGKFKVDEKISGKPVTELDLENTKITDAGLVHLKGLGNLEMLTLIRTHVTDAGLVHLKGLNKLIFLDLSGTKITDAGLEHLNGLTELGLLYLGETKVTKGGIENLKKALSTCVISHD